MSRLRSSCLVLLLAVVTGCSGPGGQPSTSPATSASSSPSGGAGPGIAAEVASYQLVRGRPGRLLVALISADNRWVSFGSVAMSFTYLGDRTGTPPPGIGMADATAVFLPIPGTPEGSGGDPTLTSPTDGRGLYAVEPITFASAGFWQVTAHGRLGDGTTFSADAAFEVLAQPTVIGVGDVAPRTVNPTLGAPGVPPAAIDSRAATSATIPDPELHSTSIAEALDAHHPAVIVFSTPVYCVSRFCGPVTDVVADLAAAYGDRADFIHVEIYRDFQAGKVNPAAIDWLETPDGDLREPWVFLVGADGHIAGSWDTMVTRGEIEPLLRALPPK